MTLDRELTTYEIEVVEVVEGMTARRDAALRLKAVLAEDVTGHDEGIAAVRAGRAMEILVPPAAGQVRQNMSAAIGGFEAARHRFQLALVAVAVDNGGNAREIGNAFAPSRQLASRYLKESREKWPALGIHEDDAHMVDAHDPAVPVPTSRPLA